MYCSGHLAVAVSSVVVMTPMHGENLLKKQTTHKIFYCNLESKNLSMHWRHHSTNSRQRSSVELEQSADLMKGSSNVYLLLTWIWIREGLKKLKVENDLHWLFSENPSSINPLGSKIFHQNEFLGHYPHILCLSKLILSCKIQIFSYHIVE